MCTAFNVDIATFQEQEQLTAIRDKLKHPDQEGKAPVTQEDHKLMDRNFEGGFGGQEDLEDRYATTLGEH